MCAGAGGEAGTRPYVRAYVTCVLRVCDVCVTCVRRVCVCVTRVTRVCACHAQRTVGEGGERLVEALARGGRRRRRRRQKHPLGQGRGVGVVPHPVVKLLERHPGGLLPRA